MRPRPTLAILLFALLALPCSAADWQKAFTVTGKPTVHVESNDASVHIAGGDSREVQVRVTATGYRIGDEVRVTEHQAGDRVEVEVHVPHGVVIGFSNRSVEIDVSLPREADLDIHTGDGRIEVTDIKGAARLSTNDGRIRVYRADGSLDASSGDGSIEADGRFDALEIRSNDGHVKVNIQPGSNIGAAGWSVRTKDGRVDVLLPEKLAAELDAETADGHVTVDIPVEASGRLSSSHMRGKLNGGGPTLHIRSGDGSIHIGRS
jgi:hypothetical protein